MLRGRGELFVDFKVVKVVNFALVNLRLRLWSDFWRLRIGWLWVIGRVTLLLVVVIKVLLVCLLSVLLGL